MSLIAVLQAVDEHIALNAMREGAALVNRLLVDYAKLGICGQGPEDRQRAAQAVFNVRDHDYLTDLHHVLKHAADRSPQDHELCARALGAAWRAEHPFRRQIEGESIRAEIGCRAAERAARVVARALQYVGFYNELVKSLENEERVLRNPHNYSAYQVDKAATDVARFRARFPDFYPEEST